MINNRELTILGAGVLLAVFCLFIVPTAFIGKAIVASIFFGSAIILSVVRLSPDNTPLEAFIIRKVRHAMKPKRLAYQDEGAENPKIVPAEEIPDVAPEEKSPPVEKEKIEGVLTPLLHIDKAPALTLTIKPVRMAWDEVSLGLLIPASLILVGVYTLYWIYQGGGEEIAFIIQSLVSLH